VEQAAGWDERGIERNIIMGWMENGSGRRSLCGTVEEVETTAATDTTNYVSISKKL
jgi:hypothetical protein